MTPRRLRALLAALGMFAGAAALCAADFPLVRAGRAASLVVAPGDAKVVQIAAQDLAHDIATVTGVTPSVGGTVAPNRPPPAAPRVLIGTLGRAPEIDALVASGALAIGDLRGAWESFLIATLAPPAVPAPTLVIVGSDRRGTAFGVYELSQQIGVSPWHWWADATPERKSELLIADGTRRFGPPSVKYRGIFLNDEDWGLQPWAATTFEPENGGIGPKTYARVFELLLRLKANTLWPAMHACTKPFNADPRNAALADDYAIVMGSSHAEPLLRNNVGEWPHDRAADYNYVTNRAGVRAYWEERVRTNGRYENLWTIGMRGVHDSAIQGAKTDAERIAVLEQVFADQRALLAAHVAPCRAGSPDPAANNPTLSIPQIFCAYKEVLDLYRGGLRVPDDVTIVWPDDNFGYVRNFASPEERRRSGGFGVYYHLSYLGRPLAYLWLCTTPPALIWEEMTKSYAHGADRVWIANVGDLKPAEIGTEFFLRLAWDVKPWGSDAQPRFLREFAAREFGEAHADRIASILDRYYTLNFARKPEHLQWWLPGQPPRHSDWSWSDLEARRSAFDDLRADADALAPDIAPDRKDAFFELVGYPVKGSALANRRYILGEQGIHLDAARDADTELRALTVRFSNDIAHGKWRGFMRLEPADAEWKSMRIAPWQPSQQPIPIWNRPGGEISLPVSFANEASRDTPLIFGLGRYGAALPLRTGESYRYEFDAPMGDCDLTFELLPTHPLRGASLRLAFSLDDAAPQTLALPVGDGGPEWAQGVLNGYRPLTTRIRLAGAGAHQLTVRGVDDGVVLDRIILTPVKP
ncbi:glycosyl hydrolase 115 family protein [Oleiharenicola sp. Vm1]|uniref:glycosyl hydrolase 115 family protein n=1 Tax=Oleiharenicola sp. Vm1 TaxID=3398393 RepID=UPI0039F59CF0